MIALDTIHVIIGLVILTGLALGAWAHRYWFYLSVLVGFSLFHYGFLKFCLMAVVFRLFR